MKSQQSITPKPDEPTLNAVGTWVKSLFQLQERIAPYFARPEVRAHAQLYLQAILSDIPRKNGWQIAEHARQSRPDGMQRLLSRTVWDEDGVRDELRTFVCQTLHPSLRLPISTANAQVFPVLVLDESGFPKRGRHSAGVAPQYCGLTGRVENCQVGVFLSYVTARGHALIDRELYLPQDWCDDPSRRRAAHDHLTASATSAESTTCLPLIPLTTYEVCHLLARLIFPAPTSVFLIGHWSRWRRTHQYWAGYYHRRRREKAS